MNKTKLLSAMFAAALILLGVVDARPAEVAPEKTVHAVATAHLDTQWRWTIQTTINEYIPNTLTRNFELFEKYPGYHFSFEGAFRYMLAKEYYPQEYKKLKQYITADRWHVCGSSLDATDTHMPSPESHIRSILLGNGYFKKEFGKSSKDIFLPDCFGFGYALPSIAVHCGLKGFSTQKLTWGSAYGLPFDIGMWEGVDGSKVVAAINPGEYVGDLKEDLSKDEKILQTINNQGAKTGLYMAYKYFGTGDTGGAPKESSVAILEKSLHSDGPVKVVSAPADLLSRQLTEAQKEKLTHYRGELLMTTHGTGCYTSQAAMKRWNRKNELLADAAERAAVSAEWLGVLPYPHEKLNAAWTRFIWHQFHDDITGTSLPEAYPFSWNDEIISLNQFSAVLENSVAAIASMLNTQVKGKPVVVYNPLAIARQDVAEANLDNTNWKSVRVFDKNGIETPSQIVDTQNGKKVLFIASLPPVGFKVYDIRPADKPFKEDPGLKISATSLENARYLIKVNNDGDVASIYDKSLKKEILSAPAQLQMLNNYSPEWPAWEITYEAVSAKPRNHVKGPAKIEIVESGPVRVSFKVTRQAEGSTFIQYIRLYNGDAQERIDFDTAIDWQSKNTLLKAAFALSAKNPLATYDLGLGAIDRGNNNKQLYEVPGQQWADLTDADGQYGVAILNDCKYGWDKPDDHTLRLTLLHTPDPGNRYQDQANLDLGQHVMTYSVMAHAASGREDVVWQAARLNQPLLSFTTTAHKGSLEELSLVQSSQKQVAIRAVKKAEDSDEYVVRLQELCGQPARAVSIRFTQPILAAREVNGSEEPISDLKVTNGQVQVDLMPYQPKAIAVKLQNAHAKQKPIRCEMLALAFNTDGISYNEKRQDGDFDGKGHAFAAELLPEIVDCDAVSFRIGPKEAGKNNMLTPSGQSLTLPQGDFNRVYVLAAAVNGDQPAVFKIDGQPVRLAIQDGSEKIGQWCSRISNTYATSLTRIDGKPASLETMAHAYIKRDRIAWVGGHRHNTALNKDEAYVFSYLFKYRLDIKPGSRTLTLPDNKHLRILAITAAHNDIDDTHAAQPLYDEAASNDVGIRAENGAAMFSDSLAVILTSLTGETVRYTIDGTDPVATSPIYKSPIVLRKTAQVKAAVLKPGADMQQIASAWFYRTGCHDAVSVDNKKSGLVMDYYEGAWKQLPDFSSLKALRQEIMTLPQIPTQVKEDGFGLRFTGYIELPKDGFYSFYSYSDDGSKIFIDGIEVVNHDGSHGPAEMGGAIGLRKGLHRLVVEYFEDHGGQVLQLEYEGPGIVKQPIPETILFH